MTRAADRSVEWYGAGGLWGSASGGSPADMTLSRISVAAARPWIVAGHYSGTMPDATIDSFAGYYGDDLAGIVTFGPGASIGQFRRLDEEIQQREVRELTRLWSPDGMPKNTESRLISLSLAALSGVLLVVSYADPSQGHMGVVYQATNFTYLGMTTSTGSRYQTPDGGSVHAKLLTVYRQRHPGRWQNGKEVAEEMGLVAIPNPAKHRYAIAVGPRSYRRRRLESTLREMALPYPKKDVA